MIDTHVHIFSKASKFASNSRYTPNYDALARDLYANMQRSGVKHAILVQPSFLGFDNSYLLEAIKAEPQKFSGIAVVEPTMSLEALKSLKEQGVLGIRLNCIGKATPDFNGDYKNLIKHLVDLKLILQIQAEGKQWVEMEDFLISSPVKISVDHFGRTPVEHESKGFQSLINAAQQSKNIYIKFSAPYRLGEKEAEVCSKIILETIGFKRILWGSDSPFTQFEGKQSYGDTLEWLKLWVSKESERNEILEQNPLRFYDFIHLN